jgi:hypothetical protein
VKQSVNIASILTVVVSIFGSLGSGVYFLTKMEGRLTSIERDAQDRERRVNRLEENFRLIYPVIQRDETNVNWLMKRQKDRDGKPDNDDP